MTKKCAGCNQDYNVDELIDMGRDVFLCGDCFIDVLGCFDGAQAVAFTKDLSNQIFKKYNETEVLDNMPSEIKLKCCDELIVNEYDKEKFFEKMKIGDYAPEDFVDFIGDESTEEFNNLMDDFIVLSIVAANMGICWSDIDDEWQEKYS